MVSTILNLSICSILLLAVGVSCLSFRPNTRVTTSRTSPLSSSPSYINEYHPGVHKENAVAAITPSDLKNFQHDKRRSFLVKLLAVSSSSSPVVLNSSVVNAFPFDDNNNNRRQLDLCLVTVLRTQYWVMNICESVKSELAFNRSITGNTDEDRENKKASDKKLLSYYLEIRMGSKALLTGKIPGGSNINVYRMAPFQLRECFKDALYYCSSAEKTAKKKQKSKSKDSMSSKICRTRDAEEYSQDIIESLAACVEFDGLENLQDSSPRASLMIGQYKMEKLLYIYRMLSERALPKFSAYLSTMYLTGNSIYSSIDDDDNYGQEALKLKCQNYIKLNYSSEIPMSLRGSTSQLLS